MPTTGGNLGLTIADANGATGWDVWMNANMGLLDAVIHLNVISRVIATPPGSPAEGDRYFVAASPTGAWAGQAGKIAVYRAAAWVFITPKEGWLLTSTADAGKIYKYESGGLVLAGDGAGSGSSLVDFKDSVRAATTTAGTLASSFENGDAIDGVTLATGDRILIKNQATASENGIYVVAASGAPTRATDFDASAEVTGGCVIAVAEGTANGDKLFLLTTNDPITVGTTSLSFAPLSAGGASLLDDLTDVVISSPSTDQVLRYNGSNWINGAVPSALVDFKDSVRVATTANGALSTAFANGQTVDGVTLATGDRILLKNQTTGSENGIYTVNASGAPTRATDADADAEVTAGCVVAVTEGTTNGDTIWMLTTNDPITVGSTSLAFAQLGGGAGVTGSGTTGNYPKFTGASVIGDGNLTEAGSPLVVQTNTANFQVNKAASGIALRINNNVGGPTSHDNYQISLFTSGQANTSYGLGVESNYIWYHSDGGHKFYSQGSAKWQINSSTSAWEPITDNQVEIGSSSKGVKKVYMPGGIYWSSGSGSPEGAVTAPVGSLYSRTDGGAGTSLYVKESGSGNTGWVAK